MLAIGAVHISSFVALESQVPPQPVYLKAGSAYYPNLYNFTIKAAQFVLNQPLRRHN